MPEEIEVPTEHLHETLKEEAEKHHHAPEISWISQVALTSALIAVLAAISSLLAGHHANEAMLEQMEATDQWAFYQSKGIKAAVLDAKLQLLAALGKETRPEEHTKLSSYEGEQGRIEEKGHELESSSRRHMQEHNLLARSVTIFQIAIAMAAISVLVRKKPLWYASVLLGLGGTFFLVQALV
jgi:hypothetical protein